MRALKSITESDCECRYENGVFHEDGMATLLKGSIETGYQVSAVTTHCELIEDKPDGWTHLYFQLACRKEDETAFAGETSFGGAGFFAFQAFGRFVWVIHLDNMNNPVSLTRDHDMLVGRVDAPYPDGSVFRIPVYDPEGFTISPYRKA